MVALMLFLFLLVLCFLGKDCGVETGEVDAMSKQLWLNLWNGWHCVLRMRMAWEAHLPCYEQVGSKG